MLLPTLDGPFIIKVTMDTFLLFKSKTYTPRYVFLYKVNGMTCKTVCLFQNKSKRRKIVCSVILSFYTRQLSQTWSYINFRIYYMCSHPGLLGLYYFVIYPEIVTSVRKLWREPGVHRFVKSQSKRGDVMYYKINTSRTVQNKV